MNARVAYSRRVPLPTDSALAALYPGADLADAFAIALPSAPVRSADAWARAVLGQQAGWTRALLKTRDVVMKRFGVKTSGDIRREGGSRGGDFISFFPVISRSEREVIVGENDKHLDFQASLLVRRRADGVGDELLATTVVHCHNTLGRVYIAVIAPFHRVIMRSNMDRALRAR
ncbi:MAG: hypothetical protein JWQ11_737 [Rhizobacter sp.]|nr:hypothetical protein [Rhizobacter sp.]